VIPMTLAEIADVVGGTFAGGDPATLVTGSVEFDSRRVGPGGLFAAFDGDRVDGHDYAPTAIAQGAVAVLAGKPLDLAHIVVPDVRAALGALARAVLARRPDLTVVGLTGSSGKTTTKDLLAAILAAHGPTVATAGSFNNELGLPHTVLRVTGQTRYLVLEMGARGVGHIRHLCGLAPPRVGLVTNVGTSHVGEFGSVEAITIGKTELVEALPADGLAVLNADDERVRGMAASTAATVVLAGEAADATVRAEDVTLDAGGRATYTLCAGGHRTLVRLTVPGRHQVANSLLALAAAQWLGVPVESAVDALDGLKQDSVRRMDVFERPDGVTVIDDSYNANPDSMGAALRSLVAIGSGRRTIAVLGFMAGLGEHAHAAHTDVGRLAAELGVDRLVAVGEDAAALRGGAATVPGWGGESVQVTDQEAAVGWLRAEVRTGDVVLVKGSRYRTWDVVDALRAEGTTVGRPGEVSA
jgi:UDP-N-acetylmuramoyl-tripeptide--D-alanyl-D-alanine ligase